MRSSASHPTSAARSRSSAATPPRNPNRRLASSRYATTATLIRQFYAAGVYPDWWKLEPLTTAVAWEQVVAAIEEHDRRTRGIVVLGLDAPEAELAASFRVAAAHGLVRGFAVGRTIFGEPARAWLGGKLDDRDVVARMAERFAGLVDGWTALRPDATA